MEVVSPLIDSVETDTERSMSLSVDDVDHSWLHESEGSWLENWWKSVGTGNLTVKSRIASKKRRFVSPVPSMKKTVEIGEVDMFQFSQEEQAASDFYDVVLNGPQGLGLNLTVSMTGKVVVQGLNRLSGGHASPAMQAGSIRKGDVLIGINGSDLEKMDLVEVTAMMKLVEKTGKHDSVRLRFRYGDVVLHSKTSWLDELKRINTLNSDSSEDRLDAFMDDPLLGIRSGRYVSSSGTGSSRFSGRELALGDVGVFKDQMVDLLLNSDVYGTSIGTQLQLPSSNPLFNRPLVVTAEMIHSRIRSRHCYPSAARVSCNGTTINELLLLNELAEEIFEWRPSYVAHLYCGFFTWKRFPKAIRTPRDRARYKYTQSVEWDPEMQKYVEVDENYRERRKEVNREQWRMLLEMLRSFRFPLRQLEEDLEFAIEIKNLNDQSEALSQYMEGVNSEDEDESDDDEEEVEEDDGGGGSERQLQRGRDKSSSVTSAGDIHSSGGGGSSGKINLDQLVQSVVSKRLLIAATTSATLEGGSGALSASGEAKSSKRISATHSKAVVLHSAPRSVAQLQSVSTHILEKLTGTHHVITSQHDEIRSMLRSEPDAIIAKLLVALDSDYNEYRQHAQQQQQLLKGRSSLGSSSYSSGSGGGRGRPNIGPVPRHYETGLEVYLPPYDVTYLIFYAFLYKLTPVLVIHPSITLILSKWMDLFCPDSILRTKDTHSAVRSTPTSTTIAYTRYDFLIYYNNNLSTVTNIKGYLEVISDLLTLMFLLKSGRSHLSIDNNEKESIRSSLNSQGVGALKKKSTASQYCRLNYLPVVVNFTAFQNEKPISGPVESFPDDASACSFINTYRELIQMDIAAAVCCAQQLFFTLENLLAITTSNEAFIDASVLLKELIARTCNTNNQLNYNPVSSAQYIVDRVQGSVHAEFHLMFSLYLKQLGHLFRANDQLAVELSVLFFPWSTPSVVRYNIFGEMHHKSIFVPLDELLQLHQRAAAASLSAVDASPPQSSNSKKKSPRNLSKQSASNRSVGVDVVWFLAAHIKYHQYLTRILTSLPPVYHRMVCKSPEVVDEWLQGCLYIDALQSSLRVIDSTTAATLNQNNNRSGTNSGSLVLGVSSSHTAPLVCARNIISASPSYYSHDPLHCLEVCSRYHYFEGVAHFTRLLLHARFGLLVMLYYELSQFSAPECSYHSKSVTSSSGSSSSDNGGVLQLLAMSLTSSLEVALIRLIEPVVTSLVTGNHVRVSYNVVDHKQAVDLLHLLWLVLYCVELANEHKTNHCDGSINVSGSGVHSTTSGDGYHTVIESLHRIELSKRDKDYSLVVEDVRQHQQTQKRVLLAAMSRLDGLMRRVLEYCTSRCSVSGNEVSSLVANSGEIAESVNNRRERSKSASSNGSSSVAGSSFRSNDEGIGGVASTSERVESNAPPIRERDVLRSVSVEVGTVLVQGVGLSHGLAILSRHPGIKSHLSDAFYLSLSSGK